jgi:hypothetical protein
VCDREGKRTLNLLLLSGRVSGTGVGGASGATSGGGGTTTGTDVQEQVLNILALKSLSDIRNYVLVFRSLAGAHLGEKGGPDGLDILDLCGLDQGLELVGLRILVSGLRRQLHLGDRTVMSTPSSARMRAA